jgi:hypothetical protein
VTRGERQRGHMELFCLPSNEHQKKKKKTGLKKDEENAFSFLIINFYYKNTTNSVEKVEIQEKNGGYRKKNGRTGETSIYQAIQTET